MTASPRSTPPVPLAADVRRTVAGLLALAALSVVLSGLYGFYYHFEGKLGHRGLPDISPTAGQLVDGFQAVAGLSLVWVLLLIALSIPSVAASLTAMIRHGLRRERERSWSVGVALICSLAYAGARLLLNKETSFATLTDLAAGEATLPFQYRALIPTIVGGLHAIPGVGTIPLRWLFGAVEALAALAAWAACARFLTPHVGGRDRARLASLGLFVVLLLNLAAPWRYNPIFFPWDTPSVALFALGLALLQEKRWGLFYLLFVVATFNRETTCFLTITYVLAGLGRVPLRRLALHGAAQLGLWLAVKASLATIFASNPVSVDGLFWLTYVRSVWILTTVPGIAYLALALGGSWVVLFGLRRRVRGTALARLYRVVPVFFIGMACVGELMEVRIYSELAPLVVAGLAVAFMSVLRDAARQNHPDRRVGDRTRHSEHASGATVVALPNRDRLVAELA